jgi:hypothetical protein
MNCESYKNAPSRHATSKESASISRMWSLTEVLLRIVIKEPASISRMWSLTKLLLRIVIKY